MKNAVIIVAAGSGKRFGSKIPKQFLKINGKPMFLWSVETFSSIKSFKQIVVVVPGNMVKTISLKCKLRFECVAGGKRRVDSVKNGLAMIKEGIDFVAIHDAARPLVFKKDIMSVLCEAEKTKAAIAVEKVKDTIKLISNKEKILKTLDRSYLRNAQTPQIFDAKILKKAYSKTKLTNITDDSELVENLGIKVSVVEASAMNFKITTKKDFLLAEKLLKL
ncbi:MAG: 2-C-methyl-D-erythritol 4-phosphate cytidylyltransferase [Endomicrobium sp.]|jgi:2-C-methyl-D-erythritol 4-phosphate cytidylyltransferase|nr:2-C-methyl-D-erythritol 4-phosphate cytidylyltransferase [Endomicrobium sp.]